MAIKTITISFNENTQDQIAKLREKWGMFSNAEVIRNAIAQTHTKEFRDYLPASRGMSITDKAQSKVELELAKDKAREEKKANELKESIERGKGICRLLGGSEIKPDGSGIGQCVYKTVDYVNPNNASQFNKKMYFDDLDIQSEEVLHKQFFNSNTHEPVPKDVAIEALKNCGEEF